jgi:catechol 2,3-dioxygenase
VTLPRDAHIGQVSLVVSDLDRSVAFYRDVLGLTSVRRDGQVAHLGPEGGRAFLQLHGEPGAVPKPRRSTGLYHFAVLVPSRAALGIEADGLAPAEMVDPTTRVSVRLGPGEE